MQLPSEVSKVKSTDLHNLIEKSPQSIRLSSGRECFFQFPVLRGHPYQYVLVSGLDKLVPPSSREINEMLGLARDLGRLVAEDLYGDPECCYLDMNGKRTGSWPDHVHVNVHVFSNRLERLELLHEASGKALAQEQAQVAPRAVNLSDSSF